METLDFKFFMPKFLEIVKTKEEYKISDNVYSKIGDVTIKIYFQVKKLLGYDGFLFFTILDKRGYIKEKFYIGFKNSQFYFISSLYDPPLNLGDLSSDSIRIKVESYYISLAETSRHSKKMKMLQTGRFISEYLSYFLGQLKEYINYDYTSINNIL